MGPMKHEKRKGGKKKPKKGGYVSLADFETIVDELAHPGRPDIVKRRAFRRGDFGKRTVVQYIYA